MTTEIILEPSESPVIRKMKVKYNQQSTKVEGYFPNSIKYKNNVIDEQSKTIDGSPYIEITEEEHQAVMGKKMCVVGGVFQEYVKTNDELLAEAKAAKKEEIIKVRNSAFAKPLQVRSNPDVYLRPQPQVNIFLAAYSMNDGATKEWAPCDEDGNIQDTEVAFTKEELVSASNHYEERKTTQYNQARRRCRAVDALTTIEEVEAYDITTVYE